MSDPTAVAAPAPVAPTAEPSAPAPVVERSLQQFRADREAERAKALEPTPALPASQPEPAVPVSPLAAASEPPEDADEPETPSIPAPEQDGHRWKDPAFPGVRLDLRRRDHRRIKALLEDGHRTAEENRELRARLSGAGQPGPQGAPRQPRAPASDPNEAAPTLEQFADQPDPYGAWMDAKIEHGIRKGLHQHTSQRATVERAQRIEAAIESSQSRYDAGLPQVRERYPDFDAAYQEVFETLQRVPLPVKSSIVHRLLTDEHGHDLTYFLGNHPDDLRRLVSARSRAEQQFVMGQIVAQVKASVARPQPAAPPNPPAAPMAPVHGGGTPTGYNPATASLAQFRAKHGVRGGRRVAS